MRSVQPVSYTVHRGDSLYKIARRYNTTVGKILADNPHINRSGLIHRGDVLNLYPEALHNASLSIPSAPIPQSVSHSIFPSSPNTCKGQTLRETMRVLWEEHVMWTRSLLISIAESLRDQGEVAQRLMRNPRDMTAAFSVYYADDMTQRLLQLLTEHLELGGKIMTAYKAGGNQSVLNDLSARWYHNGDEVARLLATYNPHYSEEELRKMWYKHLDLTTQEVGFRFSGQYAADIALYDAVQNEALAMADYMAEGIIKQYPTMFL